MAKKTPTPPVQRRTAWHPIFVFTLRQVLPRGGFTVRSELQLNHQPLRVDIVIVRRGQRGVLPRLMQALVRRFGPITLIEFKGPTDPLKPADFQRLLAYAELYCLQAGIKEPRQVHLMMVATRLPRAVVRMMEAYGGRVAQEAPGVWAVRGLAHPLYCIETRAAGDHVLRFFSPDMLRRPRALMTLLDAEERGIFRAIYNEVEQFKRDPQKALRYAKMEELIMSLDELYDEIIANIPPERRLKGLKPEDRLKGLSRAERARLRALLEQDDRPTAARGRSGGTRRRRQGQK
jgi:hypothetical protein